MEIYPILLVAGLVGLALMAVLGFVHVPDASITARASTMDSAPSDSLAQGERDLVSAGRLRAVEPLTGHRKDTSAEAQVRADAGERGQRRQVALDELPARRVHVTGWGRPPRGG